MAAPSRGAKRRFVLLSSLAFAALFALVAISEGIGHPSVPPAAVAIVEDTPSGTREIPVAKFRREMRRFGVEVGLGRAPRPSDPVYRDARDTVLKSLISTAWIEGQAEEMDISIHPYEVKEAFDEYREMFLAKDSTYKKYLAETGQTTADVKEKMRISLLQSQISRAMAREEKFEPSTNEIEHYYDAALPTRYTRPPTRDVRLVAIGDRREAERAKRALERGDSLSAWRRLANRHSPDPVVGEKAGLYEGLRAEGLVAPLVRPFFTAPLNEPQGPLATSRGFYVFEVVAEHPEVVESLEEAEDGIRSTLSRQAVKESLEERQREFEATWRERTICAPAYAIDLCANYDGPDRPSGAEFACYEADPLGGRPEACPASVVQAQPVMPGTVSPQEPQGEQLAQRPRPTGLTPLPEIPSFWPGALPPGTKKSPGASPKPQAPKAAKAPLVPVKAGRIQFAAQNKSGQRVEAEAELRGVRGEEKGAVLGRGTTDVEPKGQATITVSLTPAAKRALERQSKLEVTVMITLRRPDGAEETSSKKLVLLAE